MAFFWVICSVSPPSAPLTFAGGDVALFYPVFHFVLITVTALSGICVKNSCDIVGKNVSVCIICVIPCQEMCFELYCNLKDVLINKYLALSAFVGSFYSLSHSGSVRSTSSPHGQRAQGPSLRGQGLSSGPPGPPPLAGSCLEQVSS